MKKLQILLLIPILLFVFLVSCERNEDEIVISKINYVSFEPTFNFGVDPTGTATEQISIFASSVSNENRIYNIKVVEESTTASPASYSLSLPAITIPANSNEGVLELTIVGSEVNPDGSILTLSIESQEGLLIGDPLVINLSQVCPYPETILDITFDDFPEETSWKILDTNDVVLFEGGPYPGEATLNKTLCLAPGSYKIMMEDSYGDGGGSYSLTYQGNVILLRSGAFGAGETIPFDIN